MNSVWMRCSGVGPSSTIAAGEFVWVPPGPVILAAADAGRGVTGIVGVVTLSGAWIRCNNTAYR